MITATLARYPESSRIARSRNSRNIFGRKTTTDPTPPMIPSEISDRTQSGAAISARPAEAKPASSPNPSSIRSMIGAPTVNTIWKIRYITARKIGNPNHLLVTILSIRSD